MSEVESRLKEVAIDYITATSHQTTSSSSLYAFGSWLVSEEVAQGCVRGNYRAQGYRGHIAGRAACGLSHQGTIVRLSSGCAAEYWEQLLGRADNVTRLDVQATVLPQEGCQKRLRDIHGRLRRAPKLRGKPAQFLMRYGPGGPFWCSLGNRLSDRSGRIYDKGLESRDPAYEGYLRYELELHRELALAWANRLDSTDSQEADMLFLLNGFFSSRGCPSLELSRAALSARVGPCPAAIAGDRERSLARPRSIKRSLAYLDHSIRPLVQRLIAAGLEEEVFRALGLQSSTEWTNATPSHSRNKLESSTGGRPC